MRSADALLALLDAAPIPAELAPGERITDPELYLSSLRAGLLAEHPAAVERLARVLAATHGTTGRPAPKHPSP